MCYAVSVMKSNLKKAVFCLLLALFLLPLPLIPAAQAEGAAREVTGECVYFLPDDGIAARLTDESLLSRATIKGNRSMTVDLPACEKPSMYLAWFTRPKTLTIIQSDAQGRQFKREDVTPAAPFERYELEPNCRKVALSSAQPWTVSAMRFFDGALPEDLICFNEPLQQADMLVLLGQPQALFEELGGLSALYMGKYELKTAYCYLNEDNAVLFPNTGDNRPLNEAVTALWSLGYREAPFLGGFLDHDYNELEDVQNNWTDKALEGYLVRLIRSLKPKLVVCAGGGEEDQRSAYVASQIEKAVKLAADSSKYADAGKAHKVQKLYISDPKGDTVVSYEAVKAETAAAYRHVLTRQFYKRALPETGRFTLAYTAVGQDKKKTDLTENLKAKDPPPRPRPHRPPPPR